MGKNDLLCPKCGSTDNSPPWSNAAAVAMGQIGMYRKCNRCGYSGNLFMKRDDDAPYELDIPKERKQFKIHMGKAGYFLLAFIAMFLVFLLLL